MIQIFGYGPTRWAKCVWMARELEIEFEEVEVKFNAQEKIFGDASYRNLHPFGLVPALKEGDFHLFESQAINNYLADKYPDKKLIPPPGTTDRALYDQWTFFCNSTFEHPLWSWFRHSFIYGEEIKDQKEIDRSTQELEHVLTTLEPHFKNKDFLVGESFTGADITMTYTLRWANGYQFLKNHPLLQEYMRRHLDRKHYPRHLYK